MAQNAGYTNSTARNDIGSVSASFLDSPNTTSSITYKTQFASAQNNAAVFVQRGGIAYSTITLLEVAA
jgi:Tfp pilus assembly protein FimT